MPDTLERLEAALADRYTLQRELGRGGMATVYLAEDRKHHRPVALKVLRPELAAALGPDRFLREIELSARLTHPHILPLHDSGNADGFLYYVMPYVEGESLRDRLNREKQLPVDDALQISREVADALSYAHSHGVIHRDIKPENILVESGHAVVADFGIAKAITTAGGERLTETGLSIGTPAYMSPEQAGGHDQVDGRSDLYSLGCVLYEMLAGHPPFTGTTAHELLARHATDPVPPLRTGRATIPEPIEAAVELVLSKVPADRFATAQQFSQALQLDATAYRRRQRLARRLRKLALVAAAIVIVGAAGFGISRYGRAVAWRSRPVSLNTVAVFPFRVTSTDPSVQQLDEGMVDLFWAQLPGDVGPRAVDPSALLVAWNGLTAERRRTTPEAALEVASRFEAGQVLEGAIVHAGTHLTINAWLRRVPDGGEILRRSVAGPLDSLAALVREMALALLGAQLGEDADRLAGLVYFTPDAVRAYLAGMRALRNGEVVGALLHFERAEALDSTFALPSLRIGLFKDAVQKPGESYDEAWARWERSLRRAHALQGGLSERDRAALACELVGSGVDTVESGAAHLAAAKRWATLAPDDPEAVLEYAKALWMSGGLTREADWQARFREARERAWLLDSVTPGRVMEQVWWGSLYTGDREWARRIAPALLARVDSAADRWVGARWAIAHLIGDSSTVRDFRSRAERGDPRIVNTHTWMMLADVSSRGFVPAHDFRLVDESLYEGDDADPFWTSFHRGRVRDGVRIWLGRRAWRIIIEWSYAFIGLDSAARVAAESLSALGERARGGVQAACDLEFYHVLHRDTAGVRDRMRRLEGGYRELRERPQRPVFGVCPAMVDAVLESFGHQSAAAPALERLEALLRQAPGMELPAMPGVLAVARLRRQRGEFLQALNWLGEACCWGMAVSRHFQAPYAKEEGELALLVGDTTRAIRAFERYLNIRVAPDPGVVQAEVDSVRAALNALLRAKG
jgi:hypothetical protein